VCVCVILFKNFIDFLIFAIMREMFKISLVFHHFDLFIPRFHAEHLTMFRGTLVEKKFTTLSKIH